MCVCVCPLSLVLIGSSDCSLDLLSLVLLIIQLELIYVSLIHLTPTYRDTHTKKRDNSWLVWDI